MSYEIGAKTDLLDNRLRVNAAIYRSDYDPRSIQVGGVGQCDAPSDPDPTPYRLAGAQCPPGTALAGSNPIPWFFYDNVPGELEGFEVEISATPIENLLVSYTAGTNEFTNDDLDAASPTYRNPDYRSQPEWTMSAGVQYNWQLGNGGSLTPRLDAFYQSEEHTGPSDARPGVQGVTANVCPYQCIPSYTTFNGRLTYVSADEEWRLSLAGTDITDEFYWQQLGPALSVDAETGVIGAPTTNRSGVVSRPRMWSLTIEKQF